jgi:voltage-gated potassium channel
MGGKQLMRPAELRRRFLLAFWWELKIVWPILSALVAIQLALGLLVGYREGWSINDAAYFTFVTGLTIGYGDLVPAHFGTRLIAIMIGLIGILLTGLVAAVGVRALLKATEHEAR